MIVAVATEGESAIEELDLGEVIPDISEGEVDLELPYVSSLLDSSF
jgi:hypothetical protein